MTNLVVVYQNYKNQEDKYLCIAADSMATVCLVDSLKEATMFMSVTALVQAATRLARKDGALNIIPRKMIVYEVKILERTLSRTM